MTPPIDLADIQGDILRAYGNRYSTTSYVFVRVADALRGRAWLRDLLPSVTPAVEWEPPGPATALNVAVTSAGLRALGVPENVYESFSHEFREGMAARANQLGDSGISHPRHWHAGLGSGGAHVLVTLNARDEEAWRTELGRLRAGLDAAGDLSVIHEEHAQLLVGAREHFGFADGFSQPAIEGISDANAPGGGVPERGDRWRPLAVGEFILGYEDEESRVDRQRRLPSAPIGPLGRNGTYTVWRKLRQDVALYRRTLREAARDYPHGGEELLAAKIVGRWRNGTPLVSAPTMERDGFDGRGPMANDFRYATVDPDGRRCPLGAHIRRSNPRDALGFDGKLSFRHRIIRRGMPYGTPLEDGVEADDGQDRGLLFICFNASLARQFEGVQRQWLNGGNNFGLGDDSDFLLGSNDHDGGKMTLQGDPPFNVGPQGPFVITRGGEYLFTPGITGLAAIADGTTG